MNIVKNIVFIFTAFAAFLWGLWGYLQIEAMVWIVGLERAKMGYTLLGLFGLLGFALLVIEFCQTLINLRSTETKNAI